MIAIDTLFHYCGRFGVGLCGLCPLCCSAVSVSVAVDLTRLTLLLIAQPSMGKVGKDAKNT